MLFTLNNKYWNGFAIHWTNCSFLQMNDANAMRPYAICVRRTYGSRLCGDLWIAFVSGLKKKFYTPSNSKIHASHRWNTHWYGRYLAFDLDVWIDEVERKEKYLSLREWSNFNQISSSKKNRERFVWFGRTKRDFFLGSFLKNFRIVVTFVCSIERKANYDIR